MKSSQGELQGRHRKGQPFTNLAAAGLTRYETVACFGVYGEGQYKSMVLVHSQIVAQLFAA